MYGIYHIYVLYHIMIYSMVYHMVYNIKHLIILTFRLHPARFSPLSSAPLHRLGCSMSSFTCSSPPLSFCHSDFAWLTPSVETTSVASAPAGISLSSITISKRIGQRGVRVSTHVARHQWHTAQHIAWPAQIEARQVGASAAGSLGIPYCITCIKNV
jgi:hypothetical protein